MSRDSLPSNTEEDDASLEQRFFLSSDCRGSRQVSEPATILPLATVLFNVRVLFVCPQFHDVTVRIPDKQHRIGPHARRRREFVKRNALRCQLSLGLLQILYLNGNMRTYTGNIPHFAAVSDQMYLHPIAFVPGPWHRQLWTGQLGEPQNLAIELLGLVNV